MNPTRLKGRRRFFLKCPVELWGNIPASCRKDCPMDRAHGLMRRAVGMKAPGLRGNFTGREPIPGPTGGSIKGNGSRVTSMEPARYDFQTASLKRGFGKRADCLNERKTGK